MKNWGFPNSSVGKESTCNAGDPILIPRLGRSTGEGIGCPLPYSWASLVAQLVKNPPAMWETWVRSLGWEDPLEKGKAKARLVKVMVFPMVMYGCENWTMKKAEHQRIDAFELWCWRKLLQVPLDCKEIQPVHPKGDQSWVFIGRTDAKAETPIRWPPHAKS